MAYAADRCGGCHVCGVVVSGVEWGPEIPVNGVRPAWLADDMWDKVAADCEYVGWQYPSHNTIKNVADWEWGRLHSIKLPASHFAYAAIAKGFEPWSGGDDAPGDWDEGEVLCADGRPLTSNNISWWTHGISPDCADIIGYRKRKQPEKADAKVEPSYVSVKRMTEDELHEWTRRKLGSGATTASSLVHFCRDMGITYKPTSAQRIATKTGLTVAQVEAVLAADKENN